MLLAMNDRKPYARAERVRAAVNQHAVCRETCASASDWLSALPHRAR
jgi:hypothetical protein